MEKLILALTGFGLGVTVGCLMAERKTRKERPMREKLRNFLIWLNGWEFRDLLWTVVWALVLYFIVAETVGRIA